MERSADVERCIERMLRGFTLFFLFSGVTRLADADAAALDTTTSAKHPVAKQKAVGNRSGTNNQKATPKISPSEFRYWSAARKGGRDDDGPQVPRGKQLELRHISASGTVVERQFELPRAATSVLPLPDGKLLYSTDHEIYVTSLANPGQDVRLYQLPTDSGLQFDVLTATTSATAESPLYAVVCRPRPADQDPSRILCVEPEVWEFSSIGQKWQGHPVAEVKGAETQSALYKNLYVPLCGAEGTHCLRLSWINENKFKDPHVPAHESVEQTLAPGSKDYRPILSSEKPLVDVRWYSESTLLLLYEDASLRKSKNL